jgi:hypothetical protein
MFMKNDIYYSQGIMEQPQNSGKGMAIAALVLGILGLALFCVCGSFVLGTIGIILGIVVLVSKRNGRGMAIAGIITGLLGIILSVVMLVSFKDDIDNFMYLAQNADQIIEEYEEEGKIPDFILEYEEKYGKDVFDAEQFMDQFIEGYRSESSY